MSEPFRIYTSLSNVNDSLAWSEEPTLVEQYLEESALEESVVMMWLLVLLLAMSAWIPFLL